MCFICLLPKQKNKKVSTKVFLVQMLAYESANTNFQLGRLKVGLYFATLDDVITQSSAMKIRQRLPCFWLLERDSAINGAFAR